jgi:O-antigen/teichoic acid export membrane protein
MIGMTKRLMNATGAVNWALADQAVVSGVNFLTAILIARQLGADAFGQFTLAWMAVLFLNGLQVALIISPMMSIGPKQSQDVRSGYFGEVVTQQILFAGLSFVVLLAGVSIGASWMPEWHVEGLALPLAAANLTFQLQEFIRRFLFSVGRPAAAVVNDVVRYGTQLALLGALLGNVAHDTADTLWIITASAVLAILAGIPLLVWPSLDVSRVVATTRRHWDFSKWLFASSLLSWTSGNLFMILAGFFLGAAAVGALRAAQNLMGVVGILLQGLQNVIPIRAAHHFANGGVASLIDYLRSSAILIGLAVTAVALVASSAPEYWLSLAYADQFAGYGGLLVWYSFIYIVIALELPISTGLRAVEQTRPVFHAYIAGTVFTLIAIVPLVKLFGLTGIMVGLLTTWIIQNVVMASGFGVSLRTLQSSPVLRSGDGNYEGHGEVLK